MSVAEQGTKSSSRFTPGESLNIGKKPEEVVQPWDRLDISEVEYVKIKKAQVSRIIVKLGDRALKAGSPLVKRGDNGEITLSATKGNRQMSAQLSGHTANISELVDDLEGESHNFGESADGRDYMADQGGMRVYGADSNASQHYSAEKPVITSARVLSTLRSAVGNTPTQAPVAPSEDTNGWPQRALAYTAKPAGVIVPKDPNIASPVDVSSAPEAPQAPVAPSE